MIGSAVWVWRQAGRWRWLECQLLAEWPHAFGSRQGHPHLPSQLAARLQLPPERATWGHQVHGCNWIWADEGTETLKQKRPGQGISTRSQADAVIARRQGDSAWVCTADCVPILLASRGWVAAVHAGWRGTAGGILSKVLREFLRAGIPAAAIRVAIGPSISGSVYQVSEEVAEQVLKSLPLGLDTRAALLPDPLPGKVRLDLRWVNCAQAQAQGIPSEQIAVSPHCTLSQPQDFFSYRRDGSLKDEQGRHCVQWSGIGLRLSACSSRLCPEEREQQWL